MVRLPLPARARAFFAVSAAAVVVSLAAAPGALAATIGQVGGNPNGGCYNGILADPNYVVPAGGGTITSFSYEAVYSGQYLDFLVMRPATGGYTVVGKTGVVVLATTGVNTFAANISVQAGDILGFFAQGQLTGCVRADSGSYLASSYTETDPSVGDTIPMFPSLPGYDLNESANLAPPNADLAITMPADMTVNATSPAGAVVTFAPTVTDEDLSTVSVVCSPESGSTFAIATTDVTCTATDPDGDANSPVSGSFSITVRGAAEQLADLCTASTGVGSGRGLVEKCAHAQAALAEGSPAHAKDILDAYIREVRAQAGRQIPVGTAAELIADAQQIIAVIG